MYKKFSRNFLCMKNSVESLYVGKNLYMKNSVKIFYVQKIQQKVSMYKKFSKMSLGDI